jgi:lysophospholipase L1-like esterase
MKSLFTLRAGGLQYAIRAVKPTQIATRGDAYHAAPSSGYTSATSRTVHVCPKAATSIQLEYGNWDYSGGVDEPGANSCNIKCAIEYPYSLTPSSPGPIFPVNFSGARTATIAPGQTLKSDVIAGLSLPDGATFGIRAYYSGGAAFPTGVYAINDNEGVVSNSDLCDSGTIPTNTQAAWTPCGILGVTTAANPPSILYLGDSIIYGANDSAFFFGEGGWLMRAIGSTIPFIRMARLGHQYSFEFPASAHAYRMPLNLHCKYFLCELGVNDIYTNHGGTAASIEAAVQSLIQQVKALGVQGVFVSTLTPMTLSTDSFATVANQTHLSSATEIARLAYNAWLRDTTHWAADGITGIFDVADACESARNSGFWATTGTANALGDPVSGQPTADGIHPNPNVYTIIASHVNTSVFI